MGELQAALPRHHYVDAAGHARELRQVWRTSWVCVGRRHELGLTGPGRRAVVEVAGESLVLTSGSGAGLRGFGNVCRHRGSQLVPHPPGELPEPCDARALRCGYHSWTYDLDGRLLRAPWTEDVDGFDPAAFGLHQVEVDTWGGFVFVRLAARAGGATLPDELAPVPDRTARYPLDRLVSARRLVYEVAANWKVIAENYNECYHCGPVHPELTRLVPAFGSGGNGLDGTGLDWEAGIPHRDGAWTFSFSGSSPRAPFEGLDADERTRHKGELLYPNVLLSLSAEHAAAYVLQPLSVDRTRVTFDVLVDPSEVHLPIEDCAGFWHLVNGQDWAVCESVQRGMSSSFYTSGWYAPMEDASLDIRRWLLDRLPADATADAQETG